MKKSNFKYQRRNEDIRRELSILIRDLKDPRVSTMTNVTGVRLTPDLQYCKVYFSVLGDEGAMEDTMEGLKAASGFLRRELAQSLNFRHTPELQFQLDRSVEYGARMDEIISRVSREDRERPVGEPVNADNVYKSDEAGIYGESDWMDDEDVTE